MKSINEYTGQELQWIHPNKLSGEYELRGGDDLFARFQLKGAFRSQVCAETANGNWIIKRKGITQTITILTLDSQTEPATIKRGMTGQATLHTLDGREYRWRCTSFWRDVWSWCTNEGTPLLHLTRGSRVGFEPAVRELPEAELALLTALGWYLHKLQEEDAAASSYIVPIIS